MPLDGHTKRFPVFPPMREQIFDTLEPWRKGDTWYQAPGAVAGIWYLVPGTMHQVPGARDIKGHERT